jgi:hypothetical protein
MKQEIIDKLNECETMGEVDKILAMLEYGTDYEQIDEKIDDGCDEDEEDEYVMKTSYRFFVDGEDKPTELDFYWGNVTAKIGWIKLPMSYLI